jgi:hypothetical protein
MATVDMTTGQKLRYLLASVEKPIPTEVIYPVMFQLKDRFPHEWNELKFYRTGAGIVHSKELERYISDLHWLNVVSIVEHTHYSMNEENKKFILGELGKLSEEEQTRLREMAENLESILRRGR